MRILPTENLRIPGEGSSAQGKSGPKLRPKGVGDGKSVDIPIPPGINTDVGTQEGRLSARLEKCVQARRERGRQIRLLKILRSDGE